MPNFEEVCLNWDSISQVQRHVSTWAASTFPRRTPQGVFLKLFAEISELVDDPQSGLELADILILLLDLAGMCNIDVAAALQEKMRLNYRRQWNWNESMGIAQHIEDKV